MNALRAVLIDLDGTLVDAHDAIAGGVQELARELSLPERDLPWLKSFIGRPPHEVWEALGADDPHAMTERFAERYGPLLPERTHLLPGVEAAVKRLTSLGLRLAVATTRKTGSALRTLEVKGLAAHFEVTVGRDTAGAPKPAPDVVLMAMAELGVTPEQSLMIGDTEADALAAAAAGVRCWGVLGGVGSEASLRAAGAEHILEGGLGDAPAAICARRTGNPTT